MRKIKRALISVANKEDLIPFANELAKFGVEIFSTGGTLAALQRHGIECEDVGALTHKPEAFDGRVKTISFEIEGAILFDREKHAAEANEIGLKSIDLVVCNFYPFQEIDHEEADLAELIQLIDIGGPTMVRSAAKNFEAVAVVTSPKEYTSLTEELRENQGALTRETRFQLAGKAFNRTADYEASIAMAMDQKRGSRSLRFSFQGGKTLRYGENSHQKGYFFRDANAKRSLYDMEVRGGKELSYNNILDISSAIDTVQRFNRCGCAVLKHNTPCGLAESENQRKALELAWQSDPVSAFGSVIAFNTPFLDETASFFQYNQDDRSKHKFVEVIIAPSFSEKALEHLQKKKNLRIITFDPHSLEESYKLQYLHGSLLMQELDQKLFNDIKIPTKKQPEKLDKALLSFGLKAVSHIKSNAIAIVRKNEENNFQLLGMGAGQPNRLNSVELAIERCKKNLIEEFDGDPSERDGYIQNELANSFLISEAFFPFSDSIDLCAENGIQTIIQPGGSIRDQSVIDRCNEHNLSMIFTGLRHFKH